MHLFLHFSVVLTVYDRTKLPVYSISCTIHPGVAKLIRRWIKSIDIIDINRYNPPILLSNDIGINKLESKSQKK